MKKLLAVFTFLPALAFAQTAALSDTDLSRGITLPATGAALTDESTAGSVNPAGLLGTGGAELIYLHERGLDARNDVGDGFYLSDVFFHALSVGVSTEWLRSTTHLDVRKTTWSFAFGGEPLSVGVGLNAFNSWESRTLSQLTSLNVGLQSHPLRWLSLGASALNVDAPSREGITLPRKVDFGVGFRPFKERLSLGLDYLVQTDKTPQGGFQDGSLQATIQGELVPGVVVAVGGARGVTGPDGWRFQAGLTLNTEHVGITYAYGNASGAADHVFGVRVSQARYPEMALGEMKVALLDLDSALSAGGGVLSLLGGPQEDPYLQLVDFLDRASRDRQLTGLIVKISGLPAIGLGKADELRRALLRFRAAKKTVVAVLLSGGDTEYFVASAADKVFTVPQSLLLINGLEANLTFLGDTMNKLGVHWDVAKVGAYKNAPDELIRSGSTPEQREAVNAYLDTDVKTLEHAICNARHISPDKLHEAWALGLVTAKKGEQLGLFDGTVDTEQLEKRIGELIPEGRFVTDYEPPGNDRRWGTARKIAIIPVLGDIAGGKSREDPFGLSKIAGADTVVKAIRAAAEDPRVAAIVLRVDSGGGDGLASDLMYRAVLQAKKKKPVIASMGDVAASGGYYAAMGAEKIYASPTTLTGSIGVFVLKPAVQELAEKFGVHQETLQRAPLSDILDLYKPWTPAEQKAAQSWVDAFYDDFISEVARSRHLDKAKVDTLARGRVWSGEDAQARGLVDELGGLWDALDEAKRRIHAGANEDLELTVLGEPHGLFGAFSGDDSASVLVKLGILREPMAVTQLRGLAKELGLPPLTTLQPGLKAALPFTVDVR